MLLQKSRIDLNSLEEKQTKWRWNRDVLLAKANTPMLICSKDTEQSEGEGGVEVVEDGNTSISLNEGTPKAGTSI